MKDEDKESKVVGGARNRRVTALMLRATVAGALLLLSLLAWWLQRSEMPWNWLEIGRVELVALCVSKTDQWQVAACVGLYFGGFLYLGHLLKGEQAFWKNPRSMAVAFFAICAVVAYGREYPGSTSGNDFLVLLVGLTAGQAAGFWRLWERRDGRDDFAARAFLISFVLLVAGLSWLEMEAGSVEYQYRGRQRWQGLWDTPNVYGVLMAMGFVASVGLLLRAVGSGRGEPKVKCFLQAVRVSLCLVAMTMTGTGLIHSYSRGAWLGAACGLLLLVRHWLKRPANDRTASPVLVFTRNTFPYWLLIGASLWVMGFWTLRHTEMPLVRRVFTVANPYDFSWRNRVAVVPGSLQMIGERPLVGWGWGKPTAAYERVYKPAHLTEGAAVTLNDYLMLGMTLGIPGLWAFLFWLWMIFRRNDAEEGGFVAKAFSVTTICRAASLPGLIGMIFDGVLFRMAIAVPMFVLLELGSAGFGPRRVEPTERA